MCAGVAVQYTRQEPWYHIMAQILHCSLISDRVWCYSLFEHFTGPAIFRYEGHSSTAGRILKLSCQRWILLCSCPRIRIQRLSRCRGCYGYVTALVYVQLWDNTGRDCPVIYPLITFFFFFLPSNFTSNLPLSTQSASQISSKADVFLRSVRQTGARAMQQWETRLPSPIPPPPTSARW